MKVVKTNRRLEIENYINKKQRVTMVELVEEFQVSMNTIRSDIRYLEKLGVVEKIYGGVSRVEKKLQTDFDIRDAQNTNEKRMIAEFAANLIHSGDVVFCDSGTTTKRILDFIPPSVSFTMITSSFDLITSSISNENVAVISLPGIFNKSTKTFVDQNTAKLIRKYNISKAFISVTAVDEDGSMTNSSELECEIKKSAIEQSKENYLLCDSSKFGRTSLLSFYNIKDMDLVITAGDLNEKSKSILALCNYKHIS